MLKHISFLLLLLLQWPAVRSQQHSYWQQRTDYRIDVSLNDTLHSLEGDLQLQYQNNSPDTLRFIWIHVWPNAYKNDRTAFSNQLLQNGNTRFYFSDEEKRGYINRIRFTVNGVTAVTEDHPEHQDILKLLLPTPLLPHQSASIATPFHVKLPYNISRGGHVGNTYQITQWYPKPAVYDKSGWHEMPYLDQGEFYSEFGSYHVSIHLPDSYVVAATGHLHTDTVISDTRTVVYSQDSIHDFAWFADKNFTVARDTLQLNNRTINLFAYYHPSASGHWKDGIRFMKNAVRSKSEWVGDYPYDDVKVVESSVTGGGGMEYPTICLIDKTDDAYSLDNLINHEVGHNWFYGILASNEREHPWMDEGMNTYYDKRYEELYYPGKKQSSKRNSKLPDDMETLALQSLYAMRKDQPIETNSSSFNATNYNLTAYTKTGQWLGYLDTMLGRKTFDSIMQAYFREWRFRHPMPDDFRKQFKGVTGKDMDHAFSLLDKKGGFSTREKRSLKLTGFFNLNNTDKYQYISVLPLAGYNLYDRFMPGIMVHNYSLPPSRLKFLIAPLYATGSGQLNGTANISWTVFPSKDDSRLVLSLNASRYSNDIFRDSTGAGHHLRYTRWVPSLKYILPGKNAISTVSSYLQWRTFLINETTLSFTRDTVRQTYIISYPSAGRFLNQLQWVYQDTRKLYPYKTILSAEQGKHFIRLGFTGQYFFNYRNGGGLDCRFFAGKFLYTGTKDYLTRYETDRYHLNLSAANGYEDYTYSNYFIGRNEYEGGTSRQVMIRDGAFKVRTELLSSKIGKTDDWLTAANLSTTIPDNLNPLSVLPFRVPLKLFADFGTYAEAWKPDPPTEKFLYNAGFQLTLLKNCINIYFPLVYSKPFKDYYLSTITGKRFLKTISFSIDLQQLSVQKFIPQFPF